MDESYKDLKKHEITKKRTREDQDLKEVPEASDEDDGKIEIPVKKLVIGLCFLAIIALVVFAGVKLLGSKAMNTSANVAAIVNGEPINCSYIQELYDSVPSTLKSTVSMDGLLNQTIAETVVRQEIARRNITLKPGYLDSMLNNVKAQFPDEEQFNATLVSQGLTYENLVSQLELKLSFNKMLAEDLPEMRVNRSEIQTFFDENKDRLGTPEQVRASHILVNSSELADQIVNMLKSGADFASLAKKYSIDNGSAVNGGDLGFFGKGVMVPEFENASFNLSVGEISAPVQTDFGYHIIKVTDKKPAKAAILDADMSLIIEQYLFNLKWDQNSDKVDAYIKGLVTNANVSKSINLCKFK
jgi:foldase protein PrsA